MEETVLENGKFKERIENDFNARKYYPDSDLMADYMYIIINFFTLCSIVFGDFSVTKNIMELYCKKSLIVS